MSDNKKIVSKEETFDQLEIRLGKIIKVEEAATTKKSYILTVDFGKFGIKNSVGRFTKHTPEELMGKMVLGVLNFPPRKLGNITSEALILGVQFPDADPGEATIITPLANSKMGGKLF